MNNWFYVQKRIIEMQRVIDLKQLEAVNEAIGAAKMPLLIHPQRQV